jgi:hypothetical protein
VIHMDYPIPASDDAHLWTAALVHIACTLSHASKAIGAY